VITLSNADERQIRVGIIVGNSYGNTKITNCSVYGGSITCGDATKYDQGSELVGGIVGLAEGNTVITGCYVDATLRAGGGAAYCGGIAGAAIENAKITGCTTWGDYKSTARCHGQNATNGLGYAGSIAGAKASSATISDNGGSPTLAVGTYESGKHSTATGRPYAIYVADYGDLSKKWNIKTTS
jgi:hypothetical protein